MTGYQRAVAVFASLIFEQIGGNDGGLIPLLGEDAAFGTDGTGPGKKNMDMDGKRTQFSVGSWLRKREPG